MIKNLSIQKSGHQFISACEGMVKWVLAMEVYEKVAKVVAPKKAKLAEAEKELAEQMTKLRAKQAELKLVVDKLQAMQDEFEEKKAKKEELEANIALCKLKLERAEKLLDGLGGEKTAWGNRAKELSARLDRLTGDVLLVWYQTFEKSKLSYTFILSTTGSITLLSCFRRA